MGLANVRRRILTATRQMREHSPADFPTMIECISNLTAEVVDATDVLFCLAVQNRPGVGPLDGWNTLAAQRFGPNADHDQRILSQWYRVSRNVGSDPSVHALLQTHGRPRAFLRADAADDATWEQSGIDALLAESAIRDRLVAGAPLADGVELLLVAYRREAERRFETAERRALTLLAASLRDVGRTVARAHGLLSGGAALARREREVLRLLLLGTSEPDAAARLGLTARSLHQYVVTIYQKLGVRSRAELIAHFLAPDALNATLARYGRSLNPRELTLLRWLARGLSEKEIADSVEMSMRTVHHLVGTIYRKAGVRTRAALMAQILAQGADIERPCASTG